VALPAHDPQWVFEAFCKRYGKYILLTAVTIYLASLGICIWGSVSSRASAALPPIGAFWLGTLIGMLLSFYVLEAETFTGKALGSAVSAITGAGVLALLRWVDCNPEIWLYPMGLMSGFLIGTIWEFTEPRQTEKPNA
jgi:ABC-type enterochelin transport system permease subunit